MITYREIPAPGTLDRPVVTVGVFDGVHLGHQSLIGETCRWAAETGGTSVVLSFAGHPRGQTEGKAPPEITSLEHRLSLIERAGAAVCVVLDFSDDVASTEPAGFVRETICSALGSRHVVAGFDWRFGRDRGGGEELLRDLETKGEIEVRFVDPVMCAGEVVSSTAIREAVTSGDLEKASMMLGRPFSLRGKVVRSEGRGTALGFPTANFDFGCAITPPAGVYEARTVLDDGTHLSLASLGSRPTFGDGAFAVEVHIADFSGDLYGRTIEVELGRFLREQKTFSSPEELKAQIKKDLEAARTA